MINTKKKERFLPGPGTIVLRQKDTNLVTGKPFRIKTCCSSQMLINSLREDTEYLLDLGVNGMGESNRTLPVVCTIASPLTDALKGKIKKEKITWDEKCGKAFEELKAKLVTQPILFAPDFATEFILQTDASEVGAGVVLSQRIEGEEHPIVFLSKKFSKAERNYSTVERELAAIIFGLKRLKHYLDGQKFIIETDHNPLRYLNKMGSTNPRLQRWALSLQPFNFEIKHKPGRLHGNADGLSRLE
ncbi:retrovirus-related Pol polyprotein from transposon 297 [Trichonephila clavipes]|nr:retrovirus-related Pol polyprotein from transposon 297 [Trichonephila clavipes]